MTNTPELTAFQILANWAHAKVQLDDAQKNAAVNPDAVLPCIVQFRKWHRLKKALDAANRETDLSIA